jgi:hypothetical protein
MTFGVEFEKIREAGFLAGHFHAHVSTLELAVRGLGIEGARAAAADWIRLRAGEKAAD